MKKKLLYFVAMAVLASLSLFSISADESCPEAYPCPAPGMCGPEGDAAAQQAAQDKAACLARPSQSCCLREETDSDGNTYCAEWGKQDWQWQCTKARKSCGIARGRKDKHTDKLPFHFQKTTNSGECSCSVNDCTCCCYCCNSYYTNEDGDCKCRSEIFTDTTGHPAVKTTSYTTKCLPFDKCGGSLRCRGNLLPSNASCEYEYYVWGSEQCLGGKCVLGACH